ncbi:CLUMA_CG017280, isoform A [Clunio marinus]|uniref:CLUMA_CG017280, isoform A n=1 Tax=Clunio marinus TaxID=568069 RepID=A0A1J1IX86_9DIPT|nr:CLUMA_CG017280, isoform A [Clunio marinus]
MSERNQQNDNRKSVINRILHHCLGMLENVEKALGPRRTDENVTEMEEGDEVVTVNDENFEMENQELSKDSEVEVNEAFDRKQLDDSDEYMESRENISMTDKEASEDEGTFDAINSRDNNVATTSSNCLREFHSSPRTSTRPCIIQIFPNRDEVFDIANLSERNINSKSEFVHQDSLSMINKTSTSTRQSAPISEAKVKQKVKFHEKKTEEAKGKSNLKKTAKKVKRKLTGKPKRKSSAWSRGVIKQKPRKKPSQRE